MLAILWQDAWIANIHLSRQS